MCCYRVLIQFVEQGTKADKAWTEAEIKYVFLRSQMLGRLLSVDFFEAGGVKQDDVDLQTGDDVELDRLVAFCYLWDMLNSNDGCDHALSVMI